jgi:protein gp37
MSIRTEIAYCDSTVNPIVGCRGCELHSASSPDKSTCYAAALTARWAGKPGWPYSFDQPMLFPDRIPRAVRWADLTGTERPSKPWLNGYPRIIFVNDLSDGFHSIDPEVWLTPHLEAMAASPHIWLLCTKMPQNMAAYFAKGNRSVPSNFWLMTTITRQQHLWRARDLRRIPAPVRILSLEPLLSAVGLLPALGYNDPGGGGAFCPYGDIHGVFAGGESGPRARPCDLAWIRDILRQCREAGVRAYVKQLGAQPYDTDFAGAMKRDKTVSIAATSEPWLQGFTKVHTPEGKEQKIRYMRLSDPKGANPEEWPADLRVREMPQPAAGTEVQRG